MDKLSFMTFMCPDWSLEQVIAGARQFGYAGVEPRVSSKHAHGIELAASRDERRSIRTQFSDHEVAVSCLATSCSFAKGLPKQRQANLDDARQHVDLAAEIGASRIRVFCGRPPEGWPLEKVSDAVAEQLGALADHAAGARVTVCLETHDHFVLGAAVGRTLAQVPSPAIAANWDVQHPYHHGEHPLTTWEHLRGRVAHTHVHDFLPADQSLGLVEIGAGVSPLRHFLLLLRSGGYDGYLSAEYWGELGPPEQALASYAAGMRRLLATL